MTPRAQIEKAWECVHDAQCKLAEAMELLRHAHKGGSSFPLLAAQCEGHYEELETLSKLLQREARRMPP